LDRHLPRAGAPHAYSAGAPSGCTPGGLVRDHVSLRSAPLGSICSPGQTGPRSASVSEVANNRCRPPRSGDRPERNRGHQDEPSPDDQAGRGKPARRRGRGSRARHIRRPRRACADAGSCTRAGGDAGRRAGRSAGAVVAQPLFQVAERLPPTSVRGQRPDPPWPCLKRSSCAGSCCGAPHSPAAPVGDALDRCRYRDTFRNVWPYATCGCKLVR
jgi:hypothetical protein